MKSTTGIVAALLIALGGCANTGGSTASASSKADKQPTALAAGEAPFASTYRAYPSTPTVVRNVVIYDGEGARIDNPPRRPTPGRIRQNRIDRRAILPATEETTAQPQPSAIPNPR